MSKIEFTDWLQGELDKRNWNQADLARASGLTTAGVSRVMTGSRGPGPETCKAIAKGLHLPEELVFRKAGLLSEKDQQPASLAELIHHFVTADEEEQERMLEIARLLSKRSREEPKPGET